jgi:hypothetical protein
MPITNLARGDNGRRTFNKLDLATAIALRASFYGSDALRAGSM